MAVVDRQYRLARQFIPAYLKDGPQFNGKTLGSGVQGWPNQGAQTRTSPKVINRPYAGREPNEITQGLVRREEIHLQHVVVSS